MYRGYWLTPARPRARDVSEDTGHHDVFVGTPTRLLLMRRGPPKKDSGAGTRQEKI